MIRSNYRRAGATSGSPSDNHITMPLTAGDQNIRETLESSCVQVHLRIPSVPRVRLISEGILTSLDFYITEHHPS